MNTLTKLLTGLILLLTLTPYSSRSQIVSIVNGDTLGCFTMADLKLILKDQIELERSDSLLSLMDLQIELLKAEIQERQIQSKEKDRAFGLVSDKLEIVLDEMEKVRKELKRWMRKAKFHKVLAIVGPPIAVAATLFIQSRISP